MASILMIVGILGLVAGALAVRANFRLSRGPDMPPRWRSFRVLSIMLGVAVGLSTYPLTYRMGYTVSAPDGPGRVVGIPFFVAYFDAAGNDYIGWITLAGTVANALFWFLVPQILLWLYGVRWSRRIPPKTAAAV